MQKWDLKGQCSAFLPRVLSRVTKLNGEHVSGAFQVQGTKHRNQTIKESYFLKMKF